MLSSASVRTEPVPTPSPGGAPRGWTAARPCPPDEVLRTFLERESTEEPWHNRRYRLTLQAAWPALSRAERILDLGGTSPFTAMLRTFTTAEVVSETRDLRLPFADRPGTFDVVFCLEVIEHLTDRPSVEPGALAMFTGSGIRSCLAESLRALRQGGTLVLSTPNVCSYRSLRNLLEHRHPFAFAPHHRELSLGDVRTHLVEAGFEIDTLTTIDAWSNGGGGRWWQRRMALGLWLMGYTRRDRDDDILAVARRPAPAG